MEIILRQDIPNLGYTNDLVDVKPGYARNYLIPQGKAILATDSAKKVREETLRQRSFKEEKIKKEATELAQALEGVSLRIAAKAASTGKIFGSVNNLQLADALKEQYNYDIDRKKIVVDGEHIKEVGNYVAKVKIHKQIQAEIKFEVYAE